MRIATRRAERREAWIAARLHGRRLRDEVLREKADRLGKEMRESKREPINGASTRSNCRSNGANWLVRPTGHREQAFLPGGVTPGDAFCVETARGVSTTREGDVRFSTSSFVNLHRFGPFSFPLSFDISHRLLLPHRELSRLSSGMIHRNDEEKWDPRGPARRTYTRTDTLRARATSRASCRDKR